MSVIGEEQPGDDPVARAERFYSGIGRVVSYCALMELWVFYLATTLDRANLQQHHAGKHGVALVKVCRTELAKAVDIEDAARTAITSLLDDIDQVLQKRNVVVHSIAVRPGDPEAYAHRPIPRSQREAEHQWTADAFLTDDYLRELAVEIQDCLERLYSLRPRAERSTVV